MKRKVILVLFFAICNLCVLNSQTFEWAKSAIGSSNESITGMETDMEGNTYLLGSFSKVIFFGQDSLMAHTVDTIHYQNSTDIFVVKFDALGNLKWLSQIGSNRNDAPFSISLDKRGSLFISGWCQEEAIFTSGKDEKNFGPGNFLAKYSTDGVIISIKEIKGNYKVLADIDGRFFLVGTDIIHTRNSANGNLFLGKMDQDGDFQWTKNVGNIISNVELTGACIDSKGNLYISAYTSGNFDSYELPLGHMVARYDKNGNVNWAKSFKGDRRINGIGSDALENCYVTGYFSDSSKRNKSEKIMFVEKYNKKGNLVWLKSTKGGSIMPSAISVDEGGNSIVTGTFSDTVIFKGDVTIDSIYTDKKKLDVFIVKLNTNAEVSWFTKIAGNSKLSNPYLSMDSKGGCYISGSFNTAFIFGNNVLKTYPQCCGFGDLYFSKIKDNKSGQLKGVSKKINKE